jgi:hypothetical protein
MKAFILLICLLLFCGIASGQSIPDTRANISTIDIPRLFVMNEGQWDERITASSMGLGPTVSFGREGYSVGIERGASLQSGDAAAPSWPGMRLVAPASKCTIAPMEVSGPKAKFHKDVDGHFVPYELTQYRGIAFKQAWPGIDVHVTRDASGMRHDIDVKAGADLSDFRLRFDNAEAAQLALSGTDGVPGVTPKLEEVDGGVNVSLGDAKVLRDFRVTLVYNYYWGGSDSELFTTHSIDRDGNVHIAGYTFSADFPLLPAAPASTSLGYWLYVIKTSLDGTMMYSTMYDSGSDLRHQPNTHLSAAIGKHNNLLLHVLVKPQLFHTPDAEFTAQFPGSTYHWVLLAFDSVGAIHYGTTVPDSGRLGFGAMVTDANGTLYALSCSQYTPSCITPDAIMPVNQGDYDAVIMKFHPDTYRLIYAQLFWRTGQGLDVADCCRWMRRCCHCRRMPRPGISRRACRTGSQRWRWLGSRVHAFFA